MNRTGSSLSLVSGSGWRLLGELQLPAGSTEVATLRDELEGTLHVLNLPSDMFGRLLRSVQDAAGRALQPGNVSKTGHIHLIVFVPVDVTNTVGNWGFFRIERMENRGAPEHTIEFYLYCE